MPLQNRVDPFSRLRAVPDRGAWMGNRGILHDDDRNVVRPWRGKLWIICQLSFGDRHRTLMSPGKYTELFFLDEATAFAAGHRPCGECRRDAYLRFSTLAKPGKKRLTAGELDRRLDRERRRRSNRLAEYAPCADLPAGSMVDIDGTPHLVTDEGLRAWGFGGYSMLVPTPDRTVPVLTPPTMRRVLARGYDLQLHPTASL